MNRSDSPPPHESPVLGAQRPSTIPPRPEKPSHLKQPLVLPERPSVQQLPSLPRRPPSPQYAVPILKPLEEPLNPRREYYKDREIRTPEPINRQEMMRTPDHYTPLK